MTIAFELTCLQMRQAKRRSPQSCSSGLLAGANLHPLAVVHLGVGVLHEEAADHAAEVALAEGRAPAFAVLEDPRIRLLLEDLDGVGGVLGRDQHLDELLGEALRERRVDAAVHRHDAAVGGDGIGGVGLRGRVLQGRGDPDAARVPVLHDDAGGELELAQNPAGRVQVGQVVEGELLAGELLDAREEVAAGAGLDVVRGSLVRVLAVRKLALALERDDQLGREGLAVAEPGGDRSLVRGRVREGLGGELASRLGVDLAGRLDLEEERVVAVDRADRRDVLEVLRRGAEHRRAADVDHLDGLLLAHVLPARDLREGIEVDADEVERLDSVLLERLHVRLHAAPREDRAVDPRMQRLDAAAEHLGHVGERIDRRDREAELGDVRGGSPARDELDAKLCQAGGEPVEARLVEDGDERSPDGHQGGDTIAPAR